MQSQFRAQKNAQSNQLIHRRDTLTGLSLMAVSAIGGTPLMSALADEPKNIRQIMQSLFEERKTGHQLGNSLCILESGQFYVQALIPHGAHLIFMEAVSPRFVRGWEKAVSAQGKLLLRELGFHKPDGTSPNYWIEIPSTIANPPKIASRIAVNTLKGVFGIEDLSVLLVTARIAGQAHIAGSPVSVRRSLITEASSDRYPHFRPSAVA